MQERHCPSGIYCFNDYFEGVEYAKKVNKPILINFTGHACLSSRRHEDDLFKSRKNFKLLKEDYVLINLYVDDRKALPDNERFKVEYRGKQKILKTVGDKWAFFQYENFGQVSQPWFVLLSPEEQLLTKPRGRGKGDLETQYHQFLKCGLATNRSLK